MNFSASNFGIKTWKVRCQDAKTEIQCQEKFVSFFNATFVKAKPTMEDEVDKYAEIDRLVEERRRAEESRENGLFSNNAILTLEFSQFDGFFRWR